MANTIRIKRRASGGGAGAPSTLENAELAYNEASDILYYGTGTGGAGGSATSILAIAGSGAACMLTGTQTIGGQKTFTLTPNFAASFTGFVRSAAGVLSASALIASDIPTLTSAKISDFDTQVRTTRLDQMAAPTASVSMNSQKITNLLDPTTSQDAATKSYVDTMASGLDVKASVRVATAAALPAYTRTLNVITGSANGALAAVDGVTLVLNDRILVKNGAANADNGIYYVSQVGTVGTPYTLTRATDADVSAEVTTGMFTFVEEGTTLAATGWILSTSGAITLNTTGLVFSQFSGAGTYAAGTGLTLTGSTFSVNASQTQITAVGTLTSGTWNAGVVAGQYGGTGVANTGKTITLGGNLTTSGAFATTITVTNTTTVTLPTSGTLVGSADTGTVTNTMLAGSIDLTTKVTGSLPVTNGGTGRATSTTAYGLIAAGTTATGAHQTLAAGATTDILVGGGAAALPSWTTATGSGAPVRGTAPTITGGVITALTGLAVRSTGAAFDLTFASSEVFTAGRTLSFVLGDAARTLTIGAAASVSGTNTGDQTITLTGNVTGSGTGSFATTIAAGVVTNAMLAGSIDLTAKVTGVLPIANGGTSFATYTIGDLLQASAAGVLSKLAAVATGNVLISGGVGTISSWGKVALTTHVSGILPTANGGTGIAFFTAAGPTVARTYTFPDADSTVLVTTSSIDGGTF